MSVYLAQRSIYNTESALSSKCIIELMIHTDMTDKTDKGVRAELSIQLLTSLLLCCYALARGLKGGQTSSFSR